MVQPRTCLSVSIYPGPLLKGQECKQRACCPAQRLLRRACLYPRRKWVLLPLQLSFGGFGVIMALVQCNAKPGLGSNAAQDSIRPR